MKSNRTISKILAVGLMGALLSACGTGFQSIEEAGGDITSSSRFQNALRLNEAVEEVTATGSSETSSGSASATSPSQPRTPAEACGLSVSRIELDKPQSEAERLGLLEANLEEVVERLKAAEKDLSELKGPNGETLKTPETLLAEIRQKIDALENDEETQAAYQRGRQLALKNREKIKEHLQGLTPPTQEQRECLKRASCERLKEDQDRREQEISEKRPELLEKLQELHDKVRRQICGE